MQSQIRAKWPRTSGAELTVSTLTASSPSGVTEQVSSPRTRLRLIGLGSMICVVVAVCIGYAFVVAPGLPYDEPSHYGYVLFVERHWALPVLGDPSVGYEAQMGPVAYFFYAAVLKVWLVLGGDPSLALRVVRLAGILPLGVAVACLGSILKRCQPHANPVLRWVAVAVVLLNPMIVAMGMSVQNDTFSIAVCSWLLLLVLDDVEAPHLRRALLLGSVGAVAVLTKLVVLPAVAVMLVWPFIKRRRGGLTAVIASVIAAVAVCGWWFVRNLVLYNELTARQAVRVTGAVYGPAPMNPAQLALHVPKQLLTYISVPVEYYRNLIVLPAPMGLALISACVAVASLIATRMSRGMLPGPALPFVVAGVSLLSWLYAYTQLQSLPPRAAYAALPALALVMLTALRPVDGLPTLKLAAVLTPVVLLLILHAWTLLAVTGVASPGLIA